MSAPPAQLTIRTPLKTPQGRGITSTGFRETPISVRMTRREREMITEAAAKYDVSASYFMRWCAVEAATLIKDEKDGTGDDR